MNEQIANVGLISFGLTYLLLIIVAIIMRVNKVKHGKLLFVASVRMTVQLILAGYILTYIIKNPAWYFSVLYIAAMIIFATVRVISKNKWLSKKFKWIIFGSIVFSGLSILIFVLNVTIRVNMFNPRYAITIGGMIIGNTMTGLNLALKNFQELINDNENMIETLINIGAEPTKIMKPFIDKSFETAILPTLNSMLGMGIIALPGMMTGQILSGTIPTTAILYQIAIMISICTSNSIAVFIALFVGSKTLWNKKSQFVFMR
ncbi:MAG: ABC transporter permease [Clostridia bacterium]|nr:ABC transporter permease [Clostridia bacterium]